MTTTPSTQPEKAAQTPAAGTPFAVMLRGALMPSALVGLLTVIVLGVVRGSGAWVGASMGLLVALGFFGSGMFLLSKLVRDTNPFAFLAVAMAIYMGQILALLLFMIAFKDAAWVDGVALGIVAGVVTLVWQAFAFRALRNARLPVYDNPPGPSSGDVAG